MKKSISGMVVATCLTVGVFSLSACSQKNPLKTHETSQVASFAIKASQYAEKKLGIEGAHGGKYGECINNGYTDDVNCSALYGLMADFAKTQQGFSGTKKKMLADKETFARFKEIYEHDVYFNI